MNSDSSQHCPIRGVSLDRALLFFFLCYSCTMSVPLHFERSPSCIGNCANVSFRLSKNKGSCAQWETRASSASEPTSWTALRMFCGALCSFPARTTVVLTSGICSSPYGCGNDTTTMGNKRLEPPLVDEGWQAICHAVCKGVCKGVKGPEWGAMRITNTRSCTKRSKVRTSHENKNPQRTLGFARSSRERK